MKVSGSTLVQAVTQWHVRSVHGSQRNALLACTADAERRRERIEVEEFLDRHLAAKEAERARRATQQSA